MTFSILLRRSGKQTIALLALLLVTTTSFAQFGMQVGWNISSYRYSYKGEHFDRGLCMGANFGVMFRAGGEHWGVQPTLLYSQKGAVNNNDDNNYVPGIDHYTNKLNYAELSIPVMLKLPLMEKCSFDIGAGPYFSKMASAVSKVKDLDGNTTRKKFKVGADSTADFKSGDMGLSIYIGAKFSHFNMCIGYDKGFANVTPTKNEIIKNGCFSFNMGVFF